MFIVILLNVDKGYCILGRSTLNNECSLTGVKFELWSFLFNIRLKSCIKTGLASMRIFCLNIEFHTFNYYKDFS